MYSKEQDAALAASLRKSDSRADWLHLLHRIQAPLHHLAQRMGLSHEEGEEAIQETLVKFHDDLVHGRFDPARGSLFSWIWRLGRWKCIEQYRRRPADLSHRVTLREEEWLEQAEPSWTAPSADTSPTAEAFARALEELPRHISALDHAVFHAIVLERLDGNTVAAKFGISRNSAYLHKHRAMDKLRELAARPQSSAGRNGSGGVADSME